MLYGMLKLYTVILDTALSQHFCFKHNIHLAQSGISKLGLITTVLPRRNFRYILTQYIPTLACFHSILHTFLFFFPGKKIESINNYYIIKHCHINSQDRNVWHYSDYTDSRTRMMRQGLRQSKTGLNIYRQATQIDIYIPVTFQFYTQLS